MTHARQGHSLYVILDHVHINMFSFKIIVFLLKTLFVHTRAFKHFPNKNIYVYE